MRLNVLSRFVPIKDVRVVVTETMEFLKGDIMTLIAESTVYSIYRDLLIARSVYVRNIFTEKCDGPIPIEVEARHLEMYLYLILRNTLPVLNLPSEQSFDMLLGLYSTASKLQDRESKRVAIHAMVSLAREKACEHRRPLPSAQGISLVCGSTTEEDPVRSLFLDLIVDREDLDWMRSNTRGLPIDFSAMLHVAILEHQRQYTISLSNTFDRCDIRKYLEEDAVEVLIGDEVKGEKTGEAEAEDEAAESSRRTSITGSVASPGEVTPV